MAAMKPRTGDGPLEVTKEGRGIVMRVPLEGGGRLVVEVVVVGVDGAGDASANFHPQEEMPERPGRFPPELGIRQRLVGRAARELPPC